ncbi:Hypothetical predicted protein [Mytilus galloprovincialis]|uniref:Uncharacterized protein n=1 Tax=Mytilus galloprovincialis TaxID=29158 RepID=A0A8B6G0M2_MYTGA|nr:Hypothetical predicted protein [Mytilus galloprovincialis]
MSDVAAVKPDDRVIISKMIFGEKGLVNAEDSYKFNSISSEITAVSSNEKFNKYFSKFYKDRIDELELVDKSDNLTDDEDLNEVNELMDEMSEFYNDSEETSAAIEESLAKSVNTSLRSKIPDSKFKEIKSKYKRPENCQNLMIPSVNEEVWGEKHSMLNAIRSRDLKLQKIMGYVIKGMIPAIETTNDILKAALKKNTFEPTKNLWKMTDGIRMFAASCT